MKTVSDFDICRGDVYLLCKLLLCKNDMRVYNLREKQLVKLLSRHFNTDAQEMTDHLNQCGDISATIKKVATIPSIFVHLIYSFDV